MSPSLTDPNDLPNACTRPGPAYRELYEVNLRLLEFANSPGALDRRFDGPPPPYRSPSITPVYEGPTEVNEDTPELLRKLEENARRLPFLYKEAEENAFAALPRKEKKRLMDEWAALRKRMAERERREEEAFERLFFTPPGEEIPDGLFATPKNEKQTTKSVSPDLNHPTTTETRKRKREKKK